MTTETSREITDVSGGIRAEAVRGVAWLGGSRLATQLLDQVFTIVLVRLLAPGEFGLMAMTMVFTSLVRIFADLGLSPAIVQRAELDDDYLCTAFWGNLLFGLVLCALVAAASLPVARFFGEPSVAGMMAVLSLRFVVSGTTATHEAILTRQMKFSALVKRDVASIIIGGSVGVGMAMAHLGAWSLVGQSLVGFLSRGALIWTVTSWRPRLVFSWRRFRELWDFGSRVLAARFFGYTVKNADNMLVGRMLGATLLGYYAYAYGVFLSPLTNISQVLGRVTFSAFSRLQDDAGRLARGFLLTTRHLALWSIPAIAGLMLVAPEMIEVVFGRKWLPAVPTLRVLLVAGLLQSQITVWMAALQAKGRADWMLWWAMASAALYVPAFFVGLRWGIVGVAAGYLASTVVLVPFQFRLIQHLVGFSLRSYARALAPMILGAAVMTGAVMVLNGWLSRLDVAPGLRLLAAVGTGFLSYGATMIVIQPQLPGELRRLLSELRGPRQRRRPLIDKAAVEA